LISVRLLFQVGRGSTAEDNHNSLPALRVLMVSGEPFPLKLARRAAYALPGAAVLNLYGSTEVAGDVTCFQVGRVAVWLLGWGGKRTI